LNDPYAQTIHRSKFCVAIFIFFQDDVRIYGDIDYLYTYADPHIFFYILKASKAHDLSRRY